MGSAIAAAKTSDHTPWLSHDKAGSVAMEVMVCVCCGGCFWPYSWSLAPAHFAKAASIPKRMIHGINFCILVKQHTKRILT